MADRRQLVPPKRPLPAEKILLEGGQIAQVSSLEEYLASQEKQQVHDEHHSASLTERREEPAAPRLVESIHNRTDPLRAKVFNQTQLKPIPQHWQIIYGYIWPLVAAITLFTNLMIVFVLTQRDMRTPTNVVLSAIAIADIIPITGPVPWFIYLFAMGNEKQVLYPPVACYFYQHSTRSLSEIFYFLSTWLNLLLAALDYMAACWPKLTEKYCRIKVVVVEIVCLTLLAFFLNLPQALKVVFKPVKFYYRSELTWGCRALQAKWFKDLVGEYVALYDDIFTAIIVIFVDGGPALALIVLTALLIRQLKRQRIRGHILMEQARTASKRRRERHRQQEIEASARVMIFVLLAFLAVKIPFATTYTLMIIQSRFDIHFVENLVDFQKAITITDLVFVLSYPINFTIFCCCSKKSRHKCGQLLSECNKERRLARARFMRSMAGSLNSSFSRQDPEEQLRRRRLESLASSDKWGRDSIVSEISWPVPAPRLNLEQYEQQLPRIVTTGCGGNIMSADETQSPVHQPMLVDVTEMESYSAPSYSGADRGELNEEEEEEKELGQPAGDRRSMADQEPCLLGIRRLAGHLARRLSSDHLVGRDHREEEADNKRRALSLSSSRLYTLPSSTGQLANILLASLIEKPCLGSSGRLSRSHRNIGGGN